LSSVTLLRFARLTVAKVSIFQWACLGFQVEMLLKSLWGTPSDAGMVAKPMGLGVP
jgi:hypothetical protein